MLCHTSSGAAAAALNRARACPPLVARHACTVPPPPPAGVPVIFLLSTAATAAVVWVVETRMFTVQNALYYAFAVRHPATHVLRAGLCTGWWALMLTAATEAMNSTLYGYYISILKARKLPACHAASVTPLTLPPPLLPPLPRSCWAASRCFSPSTCSRCCLQRC